MKIIDAHVHYSKIASFEECARHTSIVDYSESGYLKETADNEVVQTICMGLVETSRGGFPDKAAQMPMVADLAESMPPGMSLCLGINPHSLSDNSLAKTEDLLNNCVNIVGMKIYAGYYHIDILDPVYTPVYMLAEKYDKTIVIHTGETFSSRGLLKYCHPLLIDDLAVAHPDIRLVACHMGTPWVFDACEIAAKNPNVYIDLSGILVGNSDFLAKQTEIPQVVDRYKQALMFLNNYDKVIYGTDWPLVPMGAYIDFCKKLIPAEHHEKVFFENAMTVFKLL